MTPLGAERQATTEQRHWFPPALANSHLIGKDSACGFSQAE